MLGSGGHLPYSVVTPLLVIAPPEQATVGFESDHSPSPGKGLGAEIEVAKQEREDLEGAQRADAVTQSIANRQVASVNTATLAQKVGHGFRALVVNNRRRNVFYAITLAADDWLNAGFVHRGMVGNALEYLAERDHFPGLESGKVDLVM